MGGTRGWLPYCRRAGIAALADFRQPVLRLGAGLLDGQFAEQTERGLAAVAGIGTVLEHEHLATSRRDLAEKAGHEGVAQFNVVGFGFRRIDHGFGEFDLGHEQSSG